MKQRSKRDTDRNMDRKPDRNQDKTKNDEKNRAYSFQCKKKFGQNFIRNPQILRSIVEKAEITAKDTVLEIGPGAGALTKELARAAKTVIAVEIDRELKPILEEQLQSFSNVDLIFADILQWDGMAYLREHYPGVRIKVVANLPYYITTPIIMKLLEEKYPIDSMTIMVQKEVADRMQAKPSTKDYGALTLAVQYYADAKIVMTVPPHVFTPAPKVMSAVIHLKRRTEGYGKQEELLFRLIGASFQQRRKTLVNALGNAGLVGKEELKAVLRDMGFSESIRGESLNLSEWMELSDKISQKFTEI